MAIEKIASDALDKLVNVKVAFDYLGDNATEEDIEMLEKEAAIAGALTKAMSTIGSKAGNVIGKLGKSDAAQKVVGSLGNAWKSTTNAVGNVASKFDASKLGQATEKAWNSNAGLKVRDYVNQNGKRILKHGVAGGAAFGAVQGAMSDYRDPQDHKVHRMKNIMRGVKRGAVLGAAGDAIFGATDYRPSKLTQDQISLNNAGQMSMDFGNKTSFERLDEMVLEKEAGLASVTTAALGMKGALSGATKAFANSSGSMTNRLMNAAGAGLKRGATGAVAGAVIGGAVDGLANKGQQDDQQQNRFQ